MCEQLKNIMQAVLSRYDGCLYNAALTKFIYLLDIESIERTGKSLSNIQWNRDNYGPFVWDVFDCAKEMPHIFEIHTEPGNKRRICLINGDTIQEADEMEKLMDEVIGKIPNPKMNFSAFKDYVYATPPMILSRGNGLLNIADTVFADQEVNDFSDELFSDPEWDEAFAYLAEN